MHISVYAYIRIYVCMYICVYVCVYVCVCSFSITQTYPCRLLPPEVSYTEEGIDSHKQHVLFP